MIGTLLIALMVATTVAVAILRHGAELTDAARELRTLDVLLAEEASRSLQSVALVLDSVVDQVSADNIVTPEDFASRESVEAIHGMLRARVAGVPQLDAVTLISAQGKLINFSRTWPVPDVDLSDREYFRLLRDHPTDEPYLSEPVLNRGSGTPTIYLARRISAPDGSFVGLVLGAIALNSFEHLYASLQLEPGDFVALWRRDGILLARHPPAAIGQRMPPESITSRNAAFRGVPGVFEKGWTLGAGDPEARVVASQAADGFPLQVNIGRSEPVILADWRREVTAIGTAVGFAAVCIAALMWALLRRFRGYEAVAALSQERERAIEARQRAEDALRQSQKMEAVGQLTGGVAHDFNNLLTVMRSSVDLLRRPNLPDARRTRYVDAIADATDRAAKLTSQLLAFSRKQALNPEVFDVAADVAAIADLVARLTGSRVHVSTTFASEPCFVHADPNQFDTALVNMAVNGRDAMPEGGSLTIAVQTATSIPESASHAPVDGAYVAISISDTGVGMPPETVDRIFEPFFTTKKVGEGTGLGLSQVFGFVKQSGGEVTVESVPGRGTTFTLYLPRVEAAATAQRPDMRVVPEQARPGRRVLVVEDNQDVGRTTVETLHELGFATVWAESGERALSELEAGRERFDIVFSDVVMPGMTGIELGQTIARRFSGLPVVLTSGYSQDLAEQGLHGFTLLRKPYALDDLARVLSEAVPQTVPKG